MKKIYLFAFLSVYISLISMSVHALERTIGLLQNDPNAFTGYTLFSPIGSTNTYLIDINGRLINSWESEYLPGASVYLLENGHLLRTCNTENTTFDAVVSGGRIQEFDWEGNLFWDFEYSDNQVCQHHDIEKLPNGNVLILAWEYKTSAEAIAAGRNPSLLPDNELWPDHIVEVEPTGPTSGDIVWEWHIWDHLIQDHDPSKDNYGVVEAHPELLDLNFISNLNSAIADWNHTNSINYNEEFDQIIISVHNMSEIYVIDHSTTTAEAAGHTGGNSGKGGDILYRWGNPQVYGAGDADDRKFFFMHDARWIEAGLPGEGNILVFNNGGRRPEGDYSSVDEITPPADANGIYSLTPGSAYGPVDQTWIYTSETSTDLYAQHLSGAHRLANGNTLICSGPYGTFFEVTMEGQTVWKYVNPVSHLGPGTQGNSYINNVFRCHRYVPDHPGLANKDLRPGDPIELCPISGNVCGECYVDLEDFSRLWQYWLQSGCGECGNADLTGDENVYSDDLVIIAGNWMTGYYLE